MVEYKYFCAIKGAHDPYALSFSFSLLGIHVKIYSKVFQWSLKNITMIKNTI